jgi:hypothetical protein
MTRNVAFGEHSSRFLTAARDFASSHRQRPRKHWAFPVWHFGKNTTSVASAGSASWRASHMKLALRVRAQPGVRRGAGRPHWCLRRAASLLRAASSCAKH